MIFAFAQRRRTLAFFVFVAFIAVWAALVYQLSPEGIVKAIGSESGYVFAFVAGFLGGVSTFTTVPYALIVITLGAAGLSPVFLGLSAAFGLVLGDSTSYLIGYHGRKVIPSAFQVYFEKFSEWLLTRKYSWLIPIVVFFYAALIPFSNDLVVISFGFARYPYWKLIIPLAAGSVVFNTIIAYLGAFGVQLFA